MPVICVHGMCVSFAMRRTRGKETHHHDERIPIEKPAVQVRYQPNSKRSDCRSDIALIREFSPHKMVRHPSYARNRDKEQLYTVSKNQHSPTKGNKRTCQFLVLQNSPEPQAQEQAITRYCQKGPPQTRRPLPPRSQGVMALSTGVVRRAPDCLAGDRLVQLSPHSKSEPEEKRVHERIAQSDGASH